MPEGYYKDIIKHLKAAGYVLGRHAKGSHEIWKHPETGVRVLVPRTHSRHTANKILQDAGIDKKL